MGGEHAVAAGGPAGGGAAVEALAGLIAREGVAGVHDVLERLAGRVGGDKIERISNKRTSFMKKIPFALRLAADKNQSSAANFDGILIADCERHRNLYCAYEAVPGRSWNRFV